MTAASLLCQDKLRVEWHILYPLGLNCSIFWSGGISIHYFSNKKLKYKVFCIITQIMRDLVETLKSFLHIPCSSNLWRIRIRIRIRIYLLARRNLLWDILRLPSSRRAALGLYVILTLWRGRGANQPPYALLHRSSPHYALRHGRRAHCFEQNLLIEIIAL